MNTKMVRGELQALRDRMGMPSADGPDDPGERPPVFLIPDNGRGDREHGFCDEQLALGEQVIITCSESCDRTCPYAPERP